MSAALKEIILLLMMAVDLTYVQTMATIAALNLLARASDGMSHRRAKMATTLNHCLLNVGIS
jgi:hypothetical protein